MVLAAGLIIISLFFKIGWLIYVSLAILVVTSFSSFLGGWIAKAWMGFGKTLGNINGKLILSIFFFLLLVPIAFFKKIISKKQISSSTTNWKTLDNENVAFDKLW